MIRKMLETLPFVRYRPPLSAPLRKLVVMATKRPVQLSIIEYSFTRKLENQGEEVIQELEAAIIFLRKERFSRRDSSNLFVAGLRSICNWNSERGVEFGLQFIHELPDSRAVRTLVTYLNRLHRHKDALMVLNLGVNVQYVQSTRKSIFDRLFGIQQKLKADNLSSPTRTDLPWLVRIRKPIKLKKKAIYFQHPLEDLGFGQMEGLKPQYDLVGCLTVSRNEEPKAAIATFRFFDEEDTELSPARIEGLTFSTNVGWYSYLRQDNEDGEFFITFELPEKSEYTVVGFQRWNAKSRVLLQPEVKLRPSSINQFHFEFNRFLMDVKRNESEIIVFMFSGTTYVQDIRANRPIRLTRELLRRGIPVIFNYHRLKRTDDHPEYKGDILFQIPIDVTKYFLSRLANLNIGKSKIFMISYPHPVIPKILNRFKVNGWIVMYDARDDWEEFEKVGQAKWYNSANEKYIVRNSDCVSAVSWPLADKLGTYEPIEPIQIIPNALSPNFLSEGYKRKGGDTIKVGYFGHLTSSWFDWDALISIAQERPSYQFEIIGHSAPDNLELPRNIELMGPKTHSEINDIAAYWSVAIIPFKSSLLSDAVDPIKIYEYMALNLPTVSFRMPQIEKYPYTITVDNVEDFCAAIDEFVNHQPLKDVLTNWLDSNTWEDRVDSMLDIALKSQDQDISLLGVNK